MASRRSSGAIQWIQYIDESTKLPYYVSIETGLSTWDEPRDASYAMCESDFKQWSRMQTPARGGYGSFGSSPLATPESVRLAKGSRYGTPAPSPAKGKEIEWVMYIDDVTGKPFYQHIGTRELVWERPEGPVALFRDDVEAYGIASATVTPGSTPEKL